MEQTPQTHQQAAATAATASSMMRCDLNSVVDVAWSIRKTLHSHVALRQPLLDWLGTFQSIQIFARKMLVGRRDDAWPRS